MQKQVKIINVTAERFGIFKALELDLEKFNQGVIAFKGNAGQGKSTAQNAIKMGTQGRATLADAQQYGENWTTETQLLDGDRKIYIGGAIRNGKIEYKLYEKDDEGKKVMNPVIDGIKATPAKYMQLISTELTFGIRDFLSDNNTVHKKFMFELFRPELEKLGVIFDKKHADYEKSILGELDKLTARRDYLRAQCQHSGAFVADFERDGHKIQDVAAMEKIDVDKIRQERNDLLIAKGQAEGNARADYQKAVSDITERGQKLVEKAREISEKLLSIYNKNIELFDKYCNKIKDASQDYKQIETLVLAAEFIDEGQREKLLDDLKSYLNIYNKPFCGLKEPQKPSIIPIVDGKLHPEPSVTYHKNYDEIISKRKLLAGEFSMIKKPEVNEAEYVEKIELLDKKIANAKVNNDYCERYILNREWVEASGKVNSKRNELAKLYAQINTGVEGLRMKPFFDDDNKMEIKTVYTGSYSPDFFENKEADERLLVSYSSTQKPIIGILLQVARLKKKEKILPYIFLDDVPICSKSRAMITKIAEDNNLTIITSITGDFDKDKLSENELLIEGGEVFFNN